jgi:hypothetical protein
MGALRLINPAFCTTDQLYKSHLVILCQAEIDEIEKIDGNERSRSGKNRNIPHHPTSQPDQRPQLAPFGEAAQMLNNQFDGLSAL